MKLPCFDLAVVSTFLQSGMRSATLDGFADESGVFADIHAHASSLQAHLETLLNRVPEAVSETCALASVPAVLARSATCARSTALAGVEYACCLVSEGDDAHGICVVRRRLMSHDASIEAVVLNVEDNSRIVDLQFYRSARLIVLRTDAAGSSSLDVVDCHALPFATIAATAGTAHDGVWAQNSSMPAADF